MSLVTVVIPTIPGREKWLERALASVAAQTYQPFATHIVTEPKPDDSYVCSRIAKARNTGLMLTETPYVAFLDDDNWWESNHLECCVKAIGTADIAASERGSEVMDDTGSCQVNRWHSSDISGCLIKVAYIRKLNGFCESYPFPTEEGNDYPVMCEHGYPTDDGCFWARSASLTQAVWTETVTWHYEMGPRKEPRGAGHLSEYGGHAKKGDRYIFPDEPVGLHS
jgi:glycosyltransferase involved in cell wall biosynthesis